MSKSLCDQLALWKIMHPTPQPQKVTTPVTKKTKSKRGTHAESPIISPAQVTITATKHEPRTFRSSRRILQVMASTPLKRGDFDKPELSKKPMGMKIGTLSICNNMAIYK